jgi:beta-lactam-binding protein with PASTA domain
MRNFIAFLKSKDFFKHLGIAIVSIAIVLWLVFKWLDITTDHNEFIEVPQFKGVKIADLTSFVADKNLRYEIIDSIYDSKLPPGTVVSQDPEEKSKVKHNRTIYLYVTSLLPKSIKMPKLLDASTRQAIQILESYGLKLGQQKRVPGLNCVLAQKYKGKSIAPGALVPKGAIIDLEIGKGDGDEIVSIPCLNGLNREDAVSKLGENGLAEGGIVCTGCKTAKDTAMAKVYKQYPPCSRSEGISSGSSVDIYITNDIILLGDTVKKQ